MRSARREDHLLSRRNPCDLKLRCKLACDLLLECRTQAQLRSAELEQPSRRKMRVVSGLIRVTQSAQSFDDIVLRIGLARVDHVIDLAHPTKVRMVFLSALG